MCNCTGLNHEPDCLLRYVDCAASREAIAERDDETCPLCGYGPREHNSEEITEKDLPI